MPTSDGNGFYTREEINQIRSPFIYPNNIITNLHFTRGQMIKDTDGYVYMHPLTLIDIKNNKDPAVRVDKTIAWLLEQAHRRFDRAIAKLHNPTN